jgi:hypothetical protein
MKTDNIKDGSLAYGATGPRRSLRLQKKSDCCGSNELFTAKPILEEEIAKRISDVVSDKLTLAYMC